MDGGFLLPQEKIRGEMFRHILFATDGSFNADQAADYAAALAIRFHSRVTILHAFNAVSMPRSELAFPNVEAFGSQKEAEALVQRAAERMHNHGVEDVQTEVVQGQPAHVILGVAENVKPDMIVMGARGVSTWQGLLMGSTSMAVVQRAEIPVLVVK